MVRQPNAQPVLRPLMVWGSAAGISTSRTSRQPDRPMLRPTATTVGLAVRKPWLTLIEIGQITALAITTTRAVVLSPNHRMASGSNAIDGSGLSMLVSSTRRSSPMRVQVARVVKTAARPMPIAIAVSRIFMVLTVESTRRPSWTPSTIALATSTGPTISSGLTPETVT